MLVPFQATFETQGESWMKEKEETRLFLKCGVKMPLPNKYNIRVHLLSLKEEEQSHRFPRGVF